MFPRCEVLDQYIDERFLFAGQCSLLCCDSINGVGYLSCRKETEERVMYSIICVWDRLIDEENGVGMGALGTTSPTNVPPYLPIW